MGDRTVVLTRTRTDVSTLLDQKCQPSGRASSSLTNSCGHSVVCIWFLLTWPAPPPRDGYQLCRPEFRISRSSVSDADVQRPFKHRRSDNPLGTLEVEILRGACNGVSGQVVGCVVQGWASAKPRYFIRKREVNFRETSIHLV